MTQDLADASIQVRVSRKTLATLAMYFHSRGDPARTKSELVRMALEGLKELLIRDKLVEEVLDSEEATNALENAGLGRLSVGMDRTYLRQLQSEVGVGEVSSHDPFVGIKKSEKERRKQISSELEEAADEIMQRDRKLKEGLKESPETVD